jgi:hypothetical protein
MVGSWAAVATKQLAPFAAVLTFVLIVVLPSSLPHSEIRAFLPACEIIQDDHGDRKLSLHVNLDLSKVLAKTSDALLKLQDIVSAPPVQLLHVWERGVAEARQAVDGGVDIVATSVQVHEGRIRRELGGVTHCGRALQVAGHSIRWHRGWVPHQLPDSLVRLDLGPRLDGRDWALILPAHANLRRVVVVAAAWGEVLHHQFDLLGAR